MKKLLFSIMGLIALNASAGVETNTPPSFTKGTNVTVLEDSGPALITNWVTNISPSTPPGTPAEAGQTVNFLVSNNNPALFTVQPAVAPNGTLTFTPATNACGSANLTIVAKDN